VIGQVRKGRLYWHTLRHLKPGQVWWQLRYRLPKPRVPADAPPPAERTRLRAEAWVPPAARANSLHAGWQFELLRERADWNEAVREPNARELLWQYRFHDFEDLVAAGAQVDRVDGGHEAGESGRRALHADWIARWIAAFPPLAPAAWDPYPVSMRVGNWVRWALAGGALDDAARASMARQLRHLQQRLEFHLRANHLLENAKALYLGGSFLAGAEADRWRARGRVLLREQVAEQVLADGGHCERSPMYHALMLGALQDCASCARAYGDEALAEELAPTLAAMDRWLRAMTHPDGGIAFFQDACHGVALQPADLHARSAALCEMDDSPFPGALHFKASGFVRLQRDDALLLLDAGAPGPAWQPGHAHAGALSIEFSLGAQRVLVNTGTSCYGSSPERLRQRGTLAHNTVCLAGRDSSEVWSGFRVARRARILRDGARTGGDGTVYGFADLEDYVGLAAESAKLRREVEVPAGGHRAEVRDFLPDAEAVLSWHLHPGVELVQEDGPAAADSSGLLLRADGRALRLRFLKKQVAGAGEGDGEDLTRQVRIEESVYASAFGVEQRNQVLRLDVPRDASGSACVLTVLTWD
jgi:uncharacterized heparinase superfamily protein